MTVQHDDNISCTKRGEAEFDSTNLQPLLNTNQDIIETNPLTAAAAQINDSTIPHIKTDTCNDDHIS